MVDSEFRIWFKNRIVPEALFPGRRVFHDLSEIEEKLEINLNEEYEKDGGQNILSYFSYTLSDEKNAIPAPKCISNLNSITLSLISDINTYKESLILYFDFLREKKGKALSFCFEKLSDREVDSLKKIYDAIICYLHKCESLPLDILCNHKDYYGLYLEKKMNLSNKHNVSENDCANLAAVQTIIDSEEERFQIVLTFEQEGFFLRNTQIYKDIYEFLSYDLQYLLKETDFYNPNENFDFVEEDDADSPIPSLSEVDPCAPSTDEPKIISLFAAISLVCDSSYNPQNDAENLYSRVEYKSGRRMVATERLHYLLRSYLQ